MCSDLQNIKTSIYFLTAAVYLWTCSCHASLRYYSLRILWYKYAYILINENSIWKFRYLCNIRPSLKSLLNNYSHIAVHIPQCTLSLKFKILPLGVSSYKLSAWTSICNLFIFVMIKLNIAEFYVLNLKQRKY